MLPNATDVPVLYMSGQTVSAAEGRIGWRNGRRAIADRVNNRTISANSVFGGHERQDGAGMRLVTAASR